VGNKRTNIALGVFGVFITALQALFLYAEFYWYFLLPVALLLFFWLFVSLDKFFLVTVFVTPLSIEYLIPDLNAGLSVPAEGLILMLTLMFWLKFIIENRPGLNFWTHPLTLAALFHLFWMLVSTIFSQVPVVSIKFLATRFWFVSAFFFLGTQLFRERATMFRYMWAYFIPLIGIVCYTLYRHYLYNFEKQPAHWVMDPFFQDHTHYGAVMAMYFPFAIGMVFVGRLSGFARLLAGLLCTILIIGLIMSISRAAWLSVFGITGLFIYMLLRIRWYVLFIGIAGVAALFFSFKTEIIMQLEKNRNVSSKDFSQHLRSVSNISSDASNTERLLRWSSALRMFEERPVTGFGPGTYQFCYAPYQRSNELTIISTNFGDGGNAHSEYLGPLAEQGLPGLLSVLLLIAASVFTACRILFDKVCDKHLRRLTYMVFLGLLTYFIHGILNNFLDTDEASVPFWGFMGILTAIDLYHSKRKGAV
jgi:putative inorganic carbon (hco3(-)) transporter